MPGRSSSSRLGRCCCSPRGSGLHAKDWDAMGQLFTETVYHDRTSLTGGEPYTAPVAQFVEGWRQTLQAMDAIHHQITNHVISIDGDDATCTANMQGTHVLANASGGPMWTVGGSTRLPAQADPGRLADLRIDLHPPVGDRQHERPEPRDGRRSLARAPPRPAAPARPREPDRQPLKVLGRGRRHYFFPRRPNRDIRRPSPLRISWPASAAILPAVSSVLMIPSSSLVGRSGPPRATVSAAFAR